MDFDIDMMSMRDLMPKRLLVDFDIMTDDMKNSNQDAVIVIDGKEGSGKSTTVRFLAKYVAMRLGMPFGVDNIHFSSKDYIEVSEKAPKYHINVMDESKEALNKKKTMSKSNVLFTNWISENRDKKQVHFILLPSIHDLDNYVAMHRCSLLIHIHKWHEECDKTNDCLSGYRLVFGHFSVYGNNKDLKMCLYNKAKFGYYAYPKYPAYSGRFKHYEVFSNAELEAYETKKAMKRSLKYTDEPAPTKKDGRKKELAPEARNNLIRIAFESGKTYADIGRATGLTPWAISKIINSDATNQTNYIDNTIEI